MARDYITISTSDDTWVVRAGGAVIAESQAALVLQEGDYPPVTYFPRADVAMSLLERTDLSTHCPHKGDASYYSVSGESFTQTNAVWTYESPLDAAAAVRDHLAFAQSDDLLVERL